MRGKFPITKMMLFTLAAAVIGGCSGAFFAEPERVTSMHYRFQEPLSFPFEITEVSTEVAVDDIQIVHQFIMHYQNTETKQELRYMLSRSVGQPDKVVIPGKQEMTLASGKKAYYKDVDYSQTIWWERDDGVIARFVYQLDGGRVRLGEHKLDPAQLIDLVNQVE